MLDIDTLLRDSNPHDRGIFFIEKCVFLTEEKPDSLQNMERCDNLSYTGVLVTEGTEYQSHGHGFVKRSEVSDFVVEVNNVTKYEHVINCEPEFYITYLEMESWFDIQSDPTPSTMWAAKSMIQLFKTMREWSQLVGGEFNSEHPMAIYSKMIFERLSPPQSIIDEIDSMPDMHLVRFLKGDPDYKKIPHPYPPASSSFNDWVISLTVDYSGKTFEQIISEL
jgi:hypothetical protein